MSRTRDRYHAVANHPYGYLVMTTEGTIKGRYKTSEEAFAAAEDMNNHHSATSGVRDFYRVEGYQRICTGGNCEAMYRKFDSAGIHILITAETEDCAPRSLAEPVLAGLYTENGTWLAQTRADDTPALFSKIARGEWEHINAS